MGADIHVTIEMRNKETGEWEALHLYKKNDDGEFQPCLVYNGRNSELFGLLANAGNIFIYPPVNNGSLVPLRGLPDDLSPYTKERYGDGQYYYNETWYDYCELESYAELLGDMNKHIKKRDKRIHELEEEVRNLKDEEEGEYDWYLELYDEDENNAIDYLQGFVGCISRVLDAYWIWNPSPGQVRVIMWFDN